MAVLGSYKWVRYLFCFVLPDRPVFERKMYCNNVSLIRKKPNNPLNASSDARWQSKPVNKLLFFFFFTILDSFVSCHSTHIWKHGADVSVENTTERYVLMYIVTTVGPLTYFVGSDSSEKMANTWVGGNALVWTELNADCHSLLLEALLCLGGTSLSFPCFFFFNLPFGLIHTLLLHWQTHYRLKSCGLHRL